MYAGNFTSHADVMSAFAVPEVDQPADADILIATYQIDGYEGSAFVLFWRGDQLFEVNGSHCSCNGLEDQWKPEETTWEACLMRHGMTEILRACFEAARRGAGLSSGNP